MMKKKLFWCGIAVILIFEMCFAAKPEIAAAVEELFKVDVKSVNTINMKKKPRRLRYSQGYTAAWKKAIVTLEPGSKTIEFFEGLN